MRCHATPIAPKCEIPYSVQSLCCSVNLINLAPDFFDQGFQSLTSPSPSSRGSENIPGASRGMLTDLRFQAFLVSNTKAQTYEFSPELGERLQNTANEQQVFPLL